MRYLIGQSRMLEAEALSLPPQRAKNCRSVFQTLWNLYFNDSFFKIKSKGYSEVSTEPFKHQKVTVPNSIGDAAFQRKCLSVEKASSKIKQYADESYKDGRKVSSKVLFKSPPAGNGKSWNKFQHCNDGIIQLEQGESVTNWLNKQTLENRVLSCCLGFAFDLLHRLGKSLWPRAA